MADIRIKDLATTATTTASDDFMAVDGATNGTRKLSAATPAFLTSVTTPSLTSPAATNLTLAGGTAGSDSVVVSNTLAASSAIIGAFKVGNGTAATNVAIGGGKVNIGSTTAGSAGAGALVVAGGLATGAASYFGGAVTSEGATARFGPAAGDHFGLVATGSGFQGAYSTDVRSELTLNANTAWSLGASYAGVGGLKVGQGNASAYAYYAANTSGDAAIFSRGVAALTFVSQAATFAGAVTVTGALKLGNAYVAGAVVGTGSITIQDSTGTTYRIPVLV